MAEQSDPLFAPADLLIMTPTPSIEILAQENLLQKHKERVEKLPQPDRLIKICTDAGFLKTVEVGQYRTKHTDEFLQIAEPVTYREYTLPRDDKSTDPKSGHLVDSREHNKDKKFSPKITSPVPELTNPQDGSTGLHLQAPRGGTHLSGVGSEHFFFLLRSLFVTVGFVYS